MYFVLIERRPHLFVEDAFVGPAYLVAIVLMGTNVEFKK
jgi:hypothetical protein